MNRNRLVAMAMAGMCVGGPFAVAACLSSDSADAMSSTQCQEYGLFVGGYSYGTDRTAVAYTFDAPHGGRIDYQTWDQYEGREWAHQSSERVTFTVYRGSTVVGVWTTADLADGVANDMTAGSYWVDGPFDRITVSHATDYTSPNSVSALACVVPNVPVELVPPVVVEAPSTTTPQSEPPSADRVTEGNSELPSELPEAVPAVAVSEQPAFTG